MADPGGGDDPVDAVLGLLDELDEPQPPGVPRNNAGGVLERPD